MEEQTPEGGPERWGAFFSLSSHRFALLCLSGCLIVEFWWCLKRRNPQMYTFGVLGLSCASPGGPIPSIGGLNPLFHPLKPPSSLSTGALLNPPFLPFHFHFAFSLPPPRHPTRGGRGGSGGVQERERQDLNDSMGQMQHAESTIYCWKRSTETHPDELCVSLTTLSRQKDHATSMSAACFKTSSFLFTWSTAIAWTRVLKPPFLMVFFSTLGLLPNRNPPSGPASFFIDHPFFASDFRQVPRRNFLQFFPFLVHCCLCCRNFHSLRHRNKLVNQIVVLQWITTFSCTVVFMMSRQWFSHTQSFGFTSFQNTRKSCFNFVGSTTPTIFLHNFTRHSRSISNFWRAFLMVSSNSLPSGSMK